MPDLPTNTLLCGDALTILKTLPDNAVQCCITSPPYYLLRSYLPDSHPDKTLEIGLEETPAAYIARLVAVFREVRRVLRPDGSLWQRVTKRDPMVTRPGPKAGSYGSRTTDSISGTMLTPARSTTLGWQPTCTCPGTSGTGHGVILNPFCGVGTVALVAARHGRSYLGIELSAEYLALARKRLSTIQPRMWVGQ